MSSKLCAFIIWALVSAVSVFWGLKLLVQGPSVPTNALAVANAHMASLGDLGRLMGSAQAATLTPQAAAPDITSRLRLLGVMAPRAFNNSGSQDTKRQRYLDLNGLALIQVDGKLPRAFKVGSVIDGEWFLRSVGLRSATLGSTTNSSLMATLEVPRLEQAATGTVPPLPPGFNPPVGSNMQNFPNLPVRPDGAFQNSQPRIGKLPVQPEIVEQAEETTPTPPPPPSGP
jgi:general secretion pathway protein C